MQRAFVQSRPDKLVSPSHTAAEGLRLLGYEVIWFAEDSLPALPLTRNTLVVGFIEVYRTALEMVGVTKPPVFNYPPALDRYLGRQIRQVHLGEVRRRFDEAEAPTFIKPATDIKSFAGRVVRNVLDLCPGLPHDTVVFESEPVTFNSEYRCFVQHGKVVGCRHYKGSPLRFPDPDDILGMVAAWQDAPAAYCLDVGVSSQTLLVEVNDAHSAGDYGLDCRTYARFLEARWCELTGASPIP